MKHGKMAILVTYPDAFTKNETIGLAETTGFEVAQIVF